MQYHVVPFIDYYIYIETEINANTQTEPVILFAALLVCLSLTHTQSYIPLLSFFNKLATIKDIVLGGWVLC